MYNKEHVTVVLPTRNNAGTVRYVIEDLYLTGYVDDLIVIDLHSNDNTINEVSYTHARLLSADSMKEAISLGIERARGDLVIFMEADGGYPAQEIGKLLAYSSDYDVIFASRTLDVGFREEMKHYAFARKYYELGQQMSRKFRCPLITDIDSRVFLIRRIHYLNKRFFLEYDDEYFFLEFILRTIKNNSKFVQIPLEWKGEFSTRNQFSGFFRRMQYLNEVKKILDDRQPRAVPIAQAEQKEKEHREKINKEEVVSREFSQEHVTIKQNVKKKKQNRIAKAFKLKKKPEQSKKEKRVTQNVNTQRKVASSVIKKAQNTTNRFDPDEFT